MRRYFLGLLVLVGMTVLLIVLLSGGGGKKATPTKTVALPDYANVSSQLEMTVDGPVNAPQNHSTVQVIINQNTATFNLIQGYDGNVVESKVYNNTHNSYSNFLYALYYAGFSAGKNAGKINFGETGRCSTGNRYVFSLSESGNDIQRYWATDCSGSASTYGGNLPLTINLFKAQIPNYGSLVANSNLYNS